MNEIKVLFISKGNFDCGNYITISRIRKHIQEINKNITIEIFCLIDGHNHAADFIQLFNHFLPHVVIGLNLVRCEFLNRVKKDYKLILILGGTDINMDMNPVTMQNSTSLIKICQRIVSFSEEMKITFLNIFSKTLFPEIPNIDIIPQGIDVSDIENLYGDLDMSKIDDQIQLSSCFVIIGRLRSVKDPNFIVKPFLDWLSAQEHQIYSLLYVGDVEERSDEILTFIKTIKSSNSIYHIDSISQRQVFKLMHRARALINCSKNEGQSTTILEAMAIGLPVIARNVPGNKNLIMDDYTGILFSSEKDFQLALTKMTKDDIVSTLITNARSFVSRNHNPITEARDYIKIINDIITPAQI